MRNVPGFERRGNEDKPSDAQCLAIPALLRHTSLAFAASTGSGKTLAYLLPTMDQLRSDEILRPAAAADRRCSPRALVLAPTRDLTTQIGLVAKALSHHFRLRVRVFEAGAQISKNARAAKANGADLVVATPRRLLRLHQAGVLSLRGVRHIVVDEADEMLLRGFDNSLQELLRKCPSIRAPPAAAAAAAEGQSFASPQLSFISATLPAEARHIIRKRWPHVEFLFSKCAHRSPSSLTHFLHECKGDKLLELTSMLHEMRLGSNERMIIFCRGVQSARAVQHALVAEGLPVSGCHGAMPEKRRQQDLHAFLSSPPASPYLVCTDLNARGVDFPEVAHVINFDFPATSALYLHRSGRTARMGRAGKVTSLVKRSELGFAQQIQAAVLKEQVIHNVQKDNTPKAKYNRRGFGRGFGPDAPHMSEKLRPTKKRMKENAARERSAKTRLMVHSSRAMARQALAHRRF
ncbi:hypothetical protein AB1Y20_011395 [Prymnesium parvum]|uniref:ATP-dependent RNA helicase n=1 Tax=Prymnesium parvum TaxID=97485 RepID=A0AB34IP77_PRYPA